MVKIVVAVCGSVAAVRVPELVRELSRQGVDSECVMSKAAKGIIHSNVLHWASGNPVVSKLSGACEHVRLCGIEGEAKALLVCPATSNTIGKIANGIDDTPVTTMAATVLGSGIPVIIVPAMHVSMYKNPFVVENIDKLKNQGVILTDPDLKENKAKLPSQEVIINKVLEVL